MNFPLEIDGVAKGRLDRRLTMTEPSLRGGCEVGCVRLAADGDDDFEEVGRRIVMAGRQVKRPRCGSA